MKTAAVVVSAFAVVGTVAPCVAQSVPPTLRTAMDQRASALRRADAATWGRLTADNFTLVTADGRLMTKSERIAQIQADKPDTSPVQKPDEETVHVYGNAAVQRSRTRGVWATLSWARGRTGWQVTSAQLTAIVPDSAAVLHTIGDNNARVIAGFKQGDAAAQAAFYTNDAV